MGDQLSLIESVVEPVFMFRGGAVPDRPSPLEALATICGPYGILHRVECVHDDERKDLYLASVIGLYNLHFEPTADMEDFVRRMDTYFPGMNFFYVSMNDHRWRPGISCTISDVDNLTFDDMDATLGKLITSLSWMAPLFKELEQKSIPSTECLRLACMHVTYTTSFQ